MTTTAKGGGKRSWQGVERQTFDEQSHKVWRAIITLLAVALVAAAGFYFWWIIQPPPRVLLVSFTDDRASYDTVPPVPMVPGDAGALISWANKTKVPTLLAKLEYDQNEMDNLLDRMMSANPEQAKFTVLDEAGDSAKGQNFSLQKRDTLIFYLRGHGVAAQVDPDSPPEPFLYTKFNGLKEVSDDNSIPVRHLLDRLAQIPQVKKLVILDCAHLNYDPRLGQIANQFPSAVARAMPANSQNMWVILPTSSGEMSAVVPHFERTLFNLAFIDALQAANHDGAKHARLPNIIKHINSRYHDIRNLRSDLEFWQTLTVLPPTDSSEGVERWDRQAATVLLPTTPIPKKTAEEKAAEAATEKKTVQSGRARRSGSGSWPTTLAAFQPPTDPNPAPMPAPTTPSGATAPSTTPSVDPAKAGAAPSTNAGPPPSGASSPATAPAAPASTAAAPSPEPKAPNPSPPVAADPNAEPKYAVNVATYRDKLAQAWQLRDEIELWDGASGASWSPVHFAPAQWRRLTARLISHEERCRAGDLANNENDLKNLIDYLQELNDSLQRNISPGGWTQDSVDDLKAAWQRFGPNNEPSRARKTFREDLARSQTGGEAERNSLQTANRALKIYADCAYRLPDYVHLQGLLMSAPGVRLDIDGEVNQYIAQLRALREEFTLRKQGDARINTVTAGELKTQAETLRNTRRQIEGKVRKLAAELAKPQATASPGRAQAICLLLQSPVLRAPERNDLLERVLPPAKATQLSMDQLVGIVRSGSGQMLFSQVAEQVQREIKVIEFLSGNGLTRSSGQSPSALNDSAASSLKKLRTLIAAGTDKQANAPAIGQEFRQFLSKIPQQLIPAATSRRQRTDSEYAADFLDLYHASLLVDGRQDAKLLYPTSIALVQPYLPELVPDRIQLTITPAVLQLTETPQEIKISVEVRTDKQTPSELQGKLSLDFDSSKMDVIDADQESGSLVDRLIHLPNKSWEGKFKVVSRVTGDDQVVPLSATAKFPAASNRPSTATQKIDVRLPRPNLIDLKVVADYRYDPNNRLANTETEREQGAEARLFPNRETTLRVLLRNLSSSEKHVTVELINPLPNERRRFYDEGGKLAEEFVDLEKEILSSPKPVTRLADRVVAKAATLEKPLVLPADSQAVEVPFEVAVPASGPPGSPALDLDVTGGLICVIKNVKNGERFVKWIDLRPYQPDELFRVEKFAVSGQNLTFQVKLVSEDLAAGLRLDTKPIEVIWDREGTGLEGKNRDEKELTLEKPIANMEGSVPKERSNVIVRLHIDKYPRAFLYHLQLNESNVIEQNNLKRNRTVGTHISRLVFEKNSFHVVPRTVTFQPAAEPETTNPDPDLVIQKLTRGVSRDFAGIKLDNKLRRQTLTFDLQADVSMAAFANGAAIEVVAQEGQKPIRFHRDRDVRIQLVPRTASNGTLSFQTSVDDFRNIPIVVDADTVMDTHLTLTAAVRSGNDTPPSDSLHELPIVFDRQAPVVEDAQIVNPKIQTLEMGPPVSAVVKFRANDRDGVGVQRVQAMLVPRGMKVEPNPDNTVEFPNPSDGELQLAIPVPPELKAGQQYEFRVQLEPVDKVGRIGARVNLDLSVIVSKPAVIGVVKPRTTFGGDTNSKADVLKDIEKAKRMFPMPPPAGGAGS